MFVFRKIWRVLLSCYLRFEIRPFSLLATHCKRSLSVIKETLHRNIAGGHRRIHKRAKR